MATVACGNCGCEYSVSDDLAGREIKCRECKATAPVSQVESSRQSSSVFLLAICFLSCAIGVALGAIGMRFWLNGLRQEPIHPQPPSMLPQPMAGTGALPDRPVETPPTAAGRDSKAALPSEPKTSADGGQNKAAVAQPKTALANAQTFKTGQAARPQQNNVPQKDLKSAVPAPAMPRRPVFEIYIDYFVHDWESEIAAEAKYGKNPFILFGRVRSVRKVENGAVLTMASRDSSRGLAYYVECHFPPERTKSLTNVGLEQDLSILCVCKGRVKDKLVVEDCELLRLNP